MYTAEYFKQQDSIINKWIDSIDTDVSPISSGSGSTTLSQINKEIAMVKRLKEMFRTPNNSDSPIDNLSVVNSPIDNVPVINSPISKYNNGSEAYQDGIERYKSIKEILLDINNSPTNSTASTSSYSSFASSINDMKLIEINNLYAKEINDNCLTDAELQYIIKTFDANTLSSQDINALILEVIQVFNS